MSKHNEHSIKEAIELLLKAYKLDDRLAEKKLISSWETVMGKMIAKHTMDLSIKQKQLFVTLDSSALRNELAMAKTKIIQSLNTHVGSEVINEIILR
ncbi:MAG: DUF721 domain-containing protein [Bacteroidota bacterium]